MLYNDNERQAVLDLLKDPKSLEDVKFIEAIKLLPYFRKLFDEPNTQFQPYVNEARTGEQKIDLTRWYQKLMDPKEPGLTQFLQSEDVKGKLEQIVSNMDYESRLLELMKCEEHGWLYAQEFLKYSDRNLRDLFIGYLGNSSTLNSYFKELPFLLSYLLKQPADCSSHQTINYRCLFDALWKMYPEDMKTDSVVLNQILRKIELADNNSTINTDLRRSVLKGYVALNLKTSHYREYSKIIALLSKDEDYIEEVIRRVPSSFDDKESFLKRFNSGYLQAHTWNLFKNGYDEIENLLEHARSYPNSTTRKVLIDMSITKEDTNAACPALHG